MSGDQSPDASASTDHTTPHGEVTKRDSRWGPPPGRPPFLPPVEGNSDREPNTCDQGGMKRDFQWRPPSGRPPFRPALEGIAIFTLAVPIERLKILMQVSSASKTITQAGGFQQMGKAFHHCCQEQGYRSLFRGYSAAFFLQGGTVMFQGQLSRWAARSRGGRPNVPINVSSGVFSSLTFCMFTYPLDFLRTRLAADIGKTSADREFTGFYNCAKTIVQQDGFRGLYRGLLVSGLGIALHRGAYFGLYGFGHGSMDPRHKNFFTTWLFGQSVSVFCGLMSYPVDLLHRQMQMQSGENHRLYLGVVQCVKTIASREGYRGFYRGLLPSLLAGGIMSTLHVLLTFRR